MCDHHHGEGGCSHEADPSIDEISEYRTYDMYAHIDMDKMTVLNEAVEGSGKKIFKSMDRRLDRTEFVESDCDEELLFNIPFAGHVKISGICFSGNEDETHPAVVKLYKDKPAMSFDDCSITPDQEISLKQDPTGSVDYPLKASKFNDLNHLSILIKANFGDDVSKLFYIGLRGEYKHDFRQRVAIATYEARAQMQDHKGEIPDAVARTLF